MLDFFLRRRTGKRSLTDGLFFIAELFFAFLSQLAELTIVFTRSGCLQHAVIIVLGSLFTGCQGCCSNENKKCSAECSAHNFNWVSVLLMRRFNRRFSRANCNGKFSSSYLSRRATPMSGFFRLTSLRAKGFGHCTPASSKSPAFLVTANRPCICAIGVICLSRGFSGPTC